MRKSLIVVAMLAGMAMPAFAQDTTPEATPTPAATETPAATTAGDEATTSSDAATPQAEPTTEPKL